MAMSALYQIDIIDEDEFQLIRAADGDNIWRWFKLIQIAKRANFKGCIVKPDLRPYTPAALAIVCNELTKASAWEAFLDLSCSLGLLCIDTTTNAYQIVHWSRWHRPPSAEPEEVRRRKEEERLRARGSVTDETPPSRNQPSVTRCHEMSRESQVVTNVTTLTRSLSDLDPDLESSLAPPAHENAHTHEGQPPDSSGRNGGQGSADSKPPSTRISGVNTFSHLQNRCLDVIRSVYLAFMPGVFDADQLVKACLELCRRQSRWDENFTEDDFCEGLRLAVEAAKACEEGGETIQMLIPWVIKVASKTYFEAAHEWRQMNIRALARGQPAMPPLVPTPPTKRKKAV